MTVRTRFAPSPTGYLHIGGVRTALFNWLFARKHGGQFILRIDDTDQQRNVAEALQPILDGFRWLGLDWDEGADIGGPHGPYYQSQKLPRYQDAVRQLLENGKAYWDYATPEELKAERESAEKEKRPYLYSRKWMAESPADRSKFEADGRAGVVRLKIPRDGECRFHDLIRGDMVVPWASEQDHVVQRADGTVLYNLANVVDDFDMKITHVIRAEEHLSNTPRQIFIAQGLGYQLPEYAHVPFVAEPGSKNKLSKRKIAQYLKNPDFKKVYEHGKAIADRLGHVTAAETFNPVIVDFYREVGYLPDAILNYLVLLGWSLDDKTEDFTRQQMIELFSLERVNKAPASFDPKKLQSFQERHFLALPVEERVRLTLPYLQRIGIVSDQPTSKEQVTLSRIIADSGPRIVVAGDILEYDYFFAADDALLRDPAAVEKRLRKPGVLGLLRDFRDRLAALKALNADELSPVIFQTLLPRLQAFGGIEKQLVFQQIDAFQRDAAIAEMYTFDANKLDSGMQRFLKAHQIQIGEIIHALRVALTGKTVGFGLYESMAILGRNSCLRRIDDAITLISTDQDVLLNHLASIPDALPKAQTPIDSSKPFALYEGSFQLSTPSKQLEGIGSIRLDWQPRPSVRFLMRLDKIGLFNPGPATIRVPALNAVAEAIVTNLHFESQNNACEIAGVPNSRFQTEQTGELNHATFYVPNFLDYLGLAIKNQRQTWAGRSVLSADGWSIVIDAVSDQDKRLASVKQDGGTAITHAGVVRRNDGSNFTVKELDDLIYGLQTYLSFARGFWVAPLLLNGHDQIEKVVWQDWTLRVFDSWRTVDSWFPVHEKDALAAGFAAFYPKWKDENWRDLLRILIYWYVLANSPGSIDRGIISAHVALDAISGGIAPDDAMPHLRHTGVPNDYVAPIELLLKTSRIDTAIPNYMGDLLSYAGRYGLASGPAAIRHLRNVIAHPDLTSRQVLQDTDELRSKFWQAWMLSVSYVELLLLWVVGYDGPYASRVGERRWVGQTELVPWSSKANLNFESAKVSS